jgi:hypothetical protein
LEWLSDTLQLTSLEGWQHVSKQELILLRAQNLVQRSGGVRELLRGHFGDNQLAVPHKSNIQLKSQRVLLKCVQQLFPDEEVKMNYKHPHLTFSNSGAPIEFDVFIPALSIAFEFQGDHHYSWHFSYGPQKEQQKRDVAKREAAKSTGIELFEIPYWWNHDMRSVGATIHQRISHLLPQYHQVKPIPSNLQ